MGLTVTILLAVLGGLMGLCLLFALLYLFVFVRPRGKAPTDAALLCDYAHRGLHGDDVPENSLRAFELACEAGYGIELDVQLSSDEVVMVFHDYVLGRMTADSRKVCELTAKELGALALADTDQTIPTFAKVLATVNGRVPLLIELKGENLDTSLCPKVAELLREYRGSFCIESFNPLLLRAMRKHLPDAFYGLLYTNVVRDKHRVSLLNMILSAMLFNGICRPDFIAFNEADRRCLPVRLATGLYRAPKFVWTVRSRTSLNEAHGCGEHAIFEGLE